ITQLRDLCLVKHNIQVVTEAGLGSIDLALISLDRYSPSQYPLELHSKPLVQVGVLSRRIHKVVPNLDHFDGFLYDDEVSPHSLQAWLLLTEARKRLTSTEHKDDHYIAQAAHELRVPLVALLSYTGRLQDQSLDYLAQMEIIETILSNGAHLMELL